MKIKLLLFLSILTTSFSYAQTNERIAAIKEMCNRSSLIIEGIVLSTDSALKVNGVIYTPYNVNVNSTIFGQVTTSKIQIFMRGGEIAGIDGVIHSSIVSHSYYLLMNYTGIIFCKKADIAGHPNAYTLEDQVCFSSTNEVIKSNPLSQHYSDINTMLKDMTDVLKTNIPQKKSPEINEKENKEEIDTIPYSEKVKNYNNYIAQLELRKKNPPVSAKTASTNYLTLSTGNEQITSDGTSKFFEFDVLAKANVSGLYFDNCLMRIKYNTSAFGSSLVANSNITITRGTAFNTTSYSIPQTTTIDQTSNTLGIPFYSTYLPVMNRTALTTSDQQLLHIKIKIKSCGKNADLQFVDVALTSGFNYYTKAANTDFFAPLTTFDNSTYTSPAANVLCSVTVDDFNTPINGGKGEILTITGKNFGATRGNGQVKFKDADNTGNANFPYIQKLDDIDYISWTDTEIKIAVPSMVQSLANKPTPGSGTFIVKNNLGDSITVSNNLSFQPLVIHYTIRQQYNTPDNKKYKDNLMNMNKSGGYTIRLDTSISNYPARKGCVIKAINDWRCKTGVNIKLGKDTLLSSSFDDDVTTIYFLNTLPSQRVAQTISSRSFCPVAINPASTTSNFDVEISRGYTYFYDTTGLPLPKGKYDFYEVVLHEIGHGLGLKHVIDDTQVMYWSTKFSSSTSVPAASRRKLLTNSGDVDGISYLVVVSPLEIIGQCANFTSHIKTTDCNKTGIDEILMGNYSFSVYPNPVSNEKVNLAFDAPINSKVNITLVDTYGRLLYNSAINNSGTEANQYTINMNDFAAGLYFINLNIDGYNVSQKIIKN